MHTPLQKIHTQLVLLARELATSCEVEAIAFNAALKARLAAPTSLVLVSEQQPDHLAESYAIA